MNIDAGILSLPFRTQTMIEVRVSGCWEWVGLRNSTGYGRYYVGRDATTGKQIHKLAHRFVYESLVGPIPVGLSIDHLCRNPPCVNPTHLEPVTNRVNTLRGNAPLVAGRHMAERTHCPRGHHYDSENTMMGTQPGNYRERVQRRRCRECERIHAWLGLQRKKYPEREWEWNDAPPRARVSHSKLDHPPTRSELLGRWRDYAARNRDRINAVRRKRRQRQKAKSKQS